MLRKLLIGGMISSIAASACSDDAKEPITLEVMTWWTEDGEKDALNALEAQYQKSHPNVTLSKLDANSAEAAFAGLDTRLFLRAPPDTYQENGGAKLLSRVVTPNGTNATSPIRPVTDIIENAKDVTILEKVSELISIRSERYGIPLNVHRINNLYYSIPKLGERQVPTDVDAFISRVCELTPKRIDGAPEPKKGALGIGTGDTWTIESLVFESLFPSVALAQKSLFYDNGKRLRFFREFWSGRSEPQNLVARQIIEETLVRTQVLWPCVQVFTDSDDNKGLGKWSDPFIALMDPNSTVTFVVMGDWATGFLESKGKREGVDYGVVPFPGTEELFIYTTDVFTLTAHTKHPDAVQGFLATALTVDAQIEFSKSKGSIPALDLNPIALSKLTPKQLETVEAFKDEAVTKVPAMSGLFTADIPAELLRDVLDDMLFEFEDLTPLESANRRDWVYMTLKNHYWMLTQWTERLDNANENLLDP